MSSTMPGPSLSVRSTLAAAVAMLAVAHMALAMTPKVPVCEPFEKAMRQCQAPTA